VLEAFFRPRGVAVVGASREKGKVGHDVLQNLIRYEFEGGIYPINPKADEILGLKCYKSVSEVPGEVDLAIVVVPAKIVPMVIDDCGSKGVGGAIIISAGFKEVGREGAELEREVIARARNHGVRIIGPNCLGLIDTTSSLNASFAAGMPDRGSIAFISQSGAFGTAILDWALCERQGFSKFISVGNKADVDESDLLEAIGKDEETNVILAYLESVSDGRHFLEAAREVTRRKPVVILKSGVTSAGAKAASSHTGALAGSDAAYTAAFKQAGVLRAHTVEELFDTATAFGLQGTIRGNRVAIVTNAGGPGIIATDAVENCGLTMAEFGRETLNQLSSALPPAANIYNPVDVIGDAGADRYDAALKAVIAADRVDGIIVIVTPQTSTRIAETAALVCRQAAATDKPVLACFMGGERIREGFDTLNNGGVPNYPFPERAVMSMDAMRRHHEQSQVPTEAPPRFAISSHRAAEVIDEACHEGRYDLGETKAREVMQAYGFRMPESLLAADADAVAAAAEKLGYPVVMKIASKDILHKSDVGGVKVGLENEDEARRAFRAIVESARRRVPDAIIDGVLVQEMAPSGKEVILGMNRDPQFGPMIMFGLGGIYVEVLKDVSFRLAPLTRRDAKTMIHEIRSLALLRGARGEKPSDLGAIVDGLLRLSQLVTDFPQIAELDINPLVVYPEGEGALALDARLGLAPKRVQASQGPTVVAGSAD